MSQLKVGMNVRTTDGKRLGKIRDVGSGTFDVERGFFMKTAFAATFAEIARIEDDGVVLTMSSKDMKS